MFGRIAAIATDVLRHGGVGAFERRLLRRLLADDAVVLFAGRDAGGWERAVREARPSARIVAVDCATLAALDNYCRDAGIRHVGMVRADADAAAALLQGAATLLRHARIDVIAFTEVPDAGPGASLARLGYAPASTGHTSLLIHQRLRPLLEGVTTSPDLAALCRTYGIRPRGVIHVGAHEGQELAAYRQMGLRDILMIEANPRVFARLQSNVGAAAGVVLANCAITDCDGPVALRVTSGDQSSSLLKLHRHREFYPTIVEAAVVVVPGKTLDTLVAERAPSPADYNFLNIDIQGAEAMALRGATETLRRIDGINVEVNFEELYAGCAQIEEIDDFLAARGFRRVATACPFHRSWGDAFYVRVPSAP